MILERSFGDYLRQSVTVHLGVGRLHPSYVSVKWTSFGYPFLAFEVFEDMTMHFMIHWWLMKTMAVVRHLDIDSGNSESRLLLRW